MRLKKNGKYFSLSLCKVGCRRTVSFTGTTLSSTTSLPRPPTSPVTFAYETPSPQLWWRTRLIAPVTACNSQGDNLGFVERERSQQWLRTRLIVPVTACNSQGNHLGYVCLPVWSSKRPFREHQTPLSCVWQFFFPLRWMQL